MEVIGGVLLIAVVVIGFQAISKAIEDAQISHYPIVKVTVKVQSIETIPSSDSESPDERRGTFVAKNGVVYTAKWLSKQQYKDLLLMKGKWGTLKIQRDRLITFDCFEDQTLTKWKYD